jgi:hypothetical protein
LFKSKYSPRQKQHAALKKLRDAGLYSGKQDKRKSLTPYQKRLVAKYDAVIKGRAVVLEPSNPKSYSKLYQVRGSKVIVHREKGERISVTKSGEIKRTKRGPIGETITKTGKALAPGQLPSRSQRRIQYAIPFARKTGRGQYTMHWVRFPTWDDLAKFMGEYESAGRYEDWTNYVFEEEVSDLSVAERDKLLDDAIVKYGRARDATVIVTQGRKVRRARKRNRARKKFMRE